MNSIKLAAAAVVLALIGGCATYPYATSFAACDSQAGACYRDCESYADTPDYTACHQSCEAEVDQCFASAYEPYRYAGASDGYGSPWYGRHGSWYPGSGYVVSLSVFNSYGYYGSRYGHHDRYRQRYYSPRRYDNRRCFF